MIKTTCFLVVGISFVFLLSCRKETPVKIQEGVEIVSATCSNGVQDANEYGIDCGPECTPCALSHPDGYESLTTNKIETSAFWGDATFPAANVLASVVNGRRVITASSGSVSFKVTFSEENPAYFQEYPLVNNPLPTNGNACLQIQYGSTVYTSYSDEVHLNFENGHYSVEFTDVYMNISNVGGYIVSDGRLICSN